MFFGIARALWPGEPPETSQILQQDRLNHYELVHIGPYPMSALGPRSANQRLHGGDRVRGPAMQAAGGHAAGCEETGGVATIELKALGAQP